MTPRQIVLALLCCAISMLLMGHIGKWPSALTGALLFVGSDWLIGWGEANETDEDEQN